jgi:hypothetical protein
MYPWMETTSTISGTSTILRSTWVISRTTVVVRLHMVVQGVELRVYGGLEGSPWSRMNLLESPTTSWAGIEVPKRMVIMGGDTWVISRTTVVVRLHKVLPGVEPRDQSNSHLLCRGTRRSNRVFSRTTVVVGVHMRVLRVGPRN